MGSWENWQKLVKGENSYQSGLPDSGVPGQEKKVSLPFQIHSCEFVNLAYPLAVGTSFPRDSYFLLVCQVLCPESLAWLSAFRDVQIVGRVFVGSQSSDWRPHNIVGQKLGLRPVCS